MASRKRKNSGRQAQIISVAIGLIIIFTFSITLIAPGSGRSSSSNPDVINNTPAPVAPLPNPNPKIEGAAPYIHSSGYFRAFRPYGADWTVSETSATGSSPTADSALARVFMNSSRLLAVIHNYIQPGVEFETLESLSENFLTPAYFAGVWSEYDSDWAETGRSVTADAVIADFTLSTGGIDYLGRATNWLEGDMLYAVRIVVPDNNSQLLDLLQGYVVPGFVGIPELQALNVDWPAFSDQDFGYVIKYPYSWQRIAGDAGRPVTFRAPASEGESKVFILTTPDYPLESAQDAEAWLVSQEPSAEVLDTQPVERGAGSGYQIAYAYTDTAGDAQSGLVVLLNDSAGTLFSANMQLERPDINLLAEEPLPALEQDTRTAVMDGFIVLPEEARTPVEADDTADAG